MNDVVAIILAAGKGKRINAGRNKNKVAYEIGGRPMIAYTVSHLKKAKIGQILVVVGFAAESVRQVLGNQVEYVTQTKRLGTGHAVKTALKKMKLKSGTIITMYGDDSSFYPVEIFHQLVAAHRHHHAKLTLVSVAVEDPTGLGRIIRDNQGHVQEIIEEKNATDNQKLIKEINTGLFCFDSQFLSEALSHLKKNPISGEYYLTDVVAYANAHGYIVANLEWPNATIWQGVNTLDQLDKVNKLTSLIWKDMT